MILIKPVKQRGFAIPRQFIKLNRIPKLSHDRKNRSNECAETQITGSV
jgi:hypothetical protein